MNDNERKLIRYVCDGDIRKSKQQAKVILNGLTSKKDELFKSNMLRRLETKTTLIDLPYNLKELLIAEDSANFPESRFILRTDEAKAVERVIAVYRASEQLANLGIAYLPALLLYGESGCGKTMLSRYIAYKTQLPFVYVRFSSVISSFLGSTQSNIAKIFEYARTSPCVLCFDEIDAVGMARGQKNDVGEMNRIVIALMQELDSLPNNVIVIGTTNRFDRLDDALVRRFPLRYELTALTLEEARLLAWKFFQHADINPSNWFDDWCAKNFENIISASTVVAKCTEKIIDIMIDNRED